KRRSPAGLGWQGFGDTDRGGGLGGGHSGVREKVHSTGVFQEYCANVSSRSRAAPQRYFISVAQVRVAVSFNWHLFRCDPQVTAREKFGDRISGFVLTRSRVLRNTKMGDCALSSAARV